MWEEEYKKDFEKNHSPDLYKVWYEKKEFVKRAIRLNPFGHTKFVWCDVGICRTDETMLWMMNFANGDRISEDRMMLLQIDEFKPADYEVQADGLKGAFLQENRVGGGIQAASAQTWLTWSDKYDAMMQRYLEAKRFVGKDQHIMASVCVEYPDLVQCIQPPEGRYRDPRQMWFYLALYLGANSERFAMITS
jgi:hypothetical protein